VVVLIGRGTIFTRVQNIKDSSSRSISCRESANQLDVGSALAWNWIVSHTINICSVTFRLGVILFPGYPYSLGLYEEK
jgi:hypothetical protein